MNVSVSPGQLDRATSHHPAASSHIILAIAVVALNGYCSGRSLPEAASTVGAFREALADAGYVEAKNVTIEYRWARYTRGDYPTA